MRVKFAALVNAADRYKKSEPPGRSTGRPAFGCGGEGGIRTHVGFQAQLVFETSTFNRSVTSPNCGRSMRRYTRRAARRNMRDRPTLCLWRLWGDSNARPLPPQGSALIH